MKPLLFVPAVFCLFWGCSAAPQAAPESGQTSINLTTDMDTITLGAGCFWCTEAIFSNMKGVQSAKPGYSGGHIKNPAYREVCSGRTGHAEVVQVVYDPGMVSLRELLAVFFQTHDPTTLNRQGADVGTQYRSAVFYHSEAQAELAKSIIKELDASGAFPNPIVTEVTAFETFYEAEPEHLDYYAKNPDQGYCRVVIRPKMEKFKKVFPDLVK